MTITGLFLLLASLGRPAWLADAQRYSGELATISYRVAIAAGDDCTEKSPLLGFSIHDLSQYGAGDRESVRAAYGFGDDPLVLAIADNGPAAHAGLRAGDSLVAIDGQRIPLTHVQTGTDNRVADLWGLLNAAARRGTVTLMVHRGSLDVSAALLPETGCATRFELGSSREIDAVADDSEVIVNVGALQFAQNEDEAAAIIAHELAHNILHHRQKIAAAPRRERRRVARLAEEEADRLSIRLLKRAHYDPRAIVQFWQRFLTQFPENRNDAALRRRVALVRAEVLDNEGNESGDRPAPRSLSPSPMQTVPPSAATRNGENL
jgi:beta-barrel assembly-enhancing protease